MQPEQFKHTFSRSEFHFLLDSRSNILSLAGINFDFRIKIGNAGYSFAEFVGFVSIEQRKSYGKELLYAIINNLTGRGIETIGFCEKEVRGFYQKAQLQILYIQAKYLCEPEDNQWVTSADDDILVLHLSDAHVQLLKSLHSENLGYIL